MAQNILESMVDYSRQREMNTDVDAVLLKQHIIVGCGGIGYWLAIQLAMLGAKRFTLIDADKIEPSNLNRIPVPLRLSGEYKVKALKLQLRMLRPDVFVQCLPVNITDDTLTLVHVNAPVARHIWDCTDDARIQRTLSRYIAQDSYVGYTKLGYEGWQLGMYSKMEDTWLHDDYTPGYTSSKANVVSSMMAAGMGILYAGHGLQGDKTVDCLEMLTRREE